MTSRVQPETPSVASACLPSVPLIRRLAVDHCRVRSALCRVS